MKRKRSQIAAGYIANSIILFMCFIFIINILVPDQKSSVTENRTLQQFPDFSFTKLVQGQYSSSFEEWFSDQFVGRDTMIHFKYLIEKVSGNKKIQNVYLSKNGLIEDTAIANEEQLTRNINAINNYCVNKGVRSGFLLAPTAINIQNDQLPSYATPIDQNAQMDSIFNSLDPSITRIDVRSILKKHKDEYLYYHSDHHWTSLASFYAFSEMATAFELGEVNKGNYEVYPVYENFEGTLAKKTGSIGIKDTIEIYVPKDNPDYLFINETDGTTSRSLYNSKSLNSSNPYDVFLSGNHAQVQIETTNDSSRHLLLFKDSYANSFIPFLLPYYQTITVIDPRYFFGDIERLFRLNLITDVLFLYNSNTFVQDTSLADVIE